VAFRTGMTFVLSSGTTVHALPQWEKGVVAIVCKDGEMQRCERRSLPHVKELFGHADCGAGIKGVFGRRPFCGEVRRDHKMWAGQNFPGIALLDSRNYAMRDCAHAAAVASPRFFKPGAIDAKSQATWVRVLAPKRKRGGTAFFRSLLFEQNNPHCPRHEVPGAEVQDYESPATSTSSPERERPESSFVDKQAGPLIRGFAALASGRRRQTIHSPPTGRRA
jgi:hypothetical protein